jgi:hypothetical protein
MVKKTKKEKIEVEETSVETTQEKKATETTKDKNPEIFSRIFYTILFAFIGWMSLWVFTFVVLIQFGFLLITGQVNRNLKGFNQEVGLFLYDMIKYLSFQTNEKPFPFRDWPYGEETENQNNNELNQQSTVKVSK